MTETTELKELQTAAHNVADHWAELLADLDGAINLLVQTEGLLDDLKVYGPIPEDFASALKKTTGAVEGLRDVASRHNKKAFERREILTQGVDA